MMRLPALATRTASAVSGGRVLALASSRGGAVAAAAPAAPARALSLAAARQTVLLQRHGRSSLCNASIQQQQWQQQWRRSLSTASDKKEEVGSSGDGGDGAKASADAKEEPAAGPPPPPLLESFVNDIGNLFQKLKSAIHSGPPPSGADGAATASGPSPNNGGKADPNEPGQGEMVVRPPSFWERFSNQESPFFSRIRGVMDGAGEIGDRFGGILGETEQAEALTLLRESHPTWQQEAFIEEIESELGPLVIGAYLGGDLDVLRATCRDQAYALLSSSVNERKAQQIVMDPRLLYMSEVELESVRIIGGLPTVIVAFHTHQLYCLRDFKGKVVEGDEDDIRAFHYLWAVQPNEQSDAEQKWQVSELAIRGVMQTY